VRRDPFAMLPFIGYHMGDYFAHWLELGRRLAAQGAALPRIYCVNWFRKGADGKFVWPGYGENMRVLKWMIDRIEGRTGEGQAHLFGISPSYEDVNWDGIDFSRVQFDSVMGIDHAAWAEELSLHDQLFKQLVPRLPEALAATNASLHARLAA